MPEQILMIEDECNLGKTLQERLQRASFEVYWAQTLAQAKAFERQVDLVLLDLGLPDGCGLSYLNLARAPTLILTARSEVEERIRGLELGAEDYLVKPFHFKELLLRIQRILKPKKLEKRQVWIGKALVNWQSYLVCRDQEEFHLSRREMALLQLLYSQQGRAISRDEILNTLWSEDEYPTPRTVDNFILRLRKALEGEGAAPVIRSVRGVGYQLKL